MGVYQNLNRMWFGTKEHMRWIDIPETGASVASLSMLASATGLNGAGYVRKSWDSHKSYSFTWPDSSDRSLASAIMSYYNGSYGRGLIYFHDPMYYETNILPKRWADPSMALANESQSLIPGIAPSSMSGAAGANGLPVKSAVYQVPAGVSTPEEDRLCIPIPPGMELHLGAIYTSTSPQAGLLISDGSSTVVPLEPILETSENVTNFILSGAPEVFLAIGSIGESATVTLRAITARLFPLDSNFPDAARGPWFAGEGHSGCRFSSDPALVNYTGVGGGQVGIAATFKEVGAWE